MFAPEAASMQFAHVKCDLSDVLGTSGIARGDDVARDLEASVGGEWHSRSDEALFVSGSAHLDSATGSGLMAFSAGLVGGNGSDATVGAFAAGPLAARAVTETVLAAGRPTDTPDRVATMRSVTGTHETWQQRVRGAPVLGAVYSMHHGPTGQLAMSGTPLGDLVARDPGPEPKRDLGTVRAAMRRELDLPKSTSIVVEPVVFPLSGGGIWAYKGSCVLRRPIADLRIFVDADNLGLLLSYDVAASATLVGEGRTFRVSPSRDAAATSVLLGELDPDPGLLRGPVIAVRPARGEPVSRPRGDYRVEPTDACFNEVSAYYHVRRAVRWFADLLGPELLTRPPFTPLGVVTDDRSVGAQVAIYVPGQNAIRFHSARRNGARSADIVVHEVTHAVADRICRLNRSASTEAKSLSEGYADYAAASILDDPRFGDYVQDAPDGARNCADPTLRFPPGFAGDNEPYSSGAVWAAVLWDLRSALGPEVADAIVFNSLSYLNPNSTFVQAVAALVEADRALFGDDADTGRHAADVQRCFDGRLT